MLCNTRDNCTVSLHCEFFCAEQGFQPSRIVCYNHYIQTVSLQNEFDCVLLMPDCAENIFHILCTCIYWCDHLYVVLSNSELQNVSHTEYMNTTFIQCVFLCSFKLCFVVNRFSHTVHTYGLGLSSCGCSVTSLLSASVVASENFFLFVLLCVSSLEDWESIRLKNQGSDEKCYNMSQLWYKPTTNGWENF